MPSADINTGHNEIFNEIFKIKEKFFPIKTSLCCDPEDAEGLTWDLGNPMPAPWCPSISVLWTDGDNQG